MAHQSFAWPRAMRTIQSSGIAFLAMAPAVPADLCLTCDMTSAKAPRGIAFRIARALILVILLLVLLPYLLVLLYRIFDPVSTVMLWRWIKGARVERTVVPLTQIAPVLPRTIIASEDARFCSHRGIDWREMRAALDEADDLSEVR